jgi:hypothetical protein
MKFDLLKIINGVLGVKTIVETVQREFKGADGKDKKIEAVQRAAVEVLPVVEEALGRNLLPDAEYTAVLSELIDAEKALMKANDAVQALRLRLAVLVTATKAVHSGIEDDGA